LKIFLPAITALTILFANCSQTRQPILELHEQQSGTGASLRGLAVVNSKIIWASGSNGVVLRSIDSGISWTVLPVPGCDKVDFRDIEAWDKNQALIMGIGNPASFYRTDDGGKNWQLVYENSSPGIFFDGMAFWDDRYGVAMSDPVDGNFYLIRTEDGGRTWQEIPAENIPRPLKDEAGFAASGTGITVFDKGLAWFGTGGGAARVIYSTDFGKTWAAAATPIRSGKASQGIFSIIFQDKNNGIIIGGDYADDHNNRQCSAISHDGGLSWELSKILPAGFRSAVTTGKTSWGSFVIATGTSGISLSLDSGNTWQFADSTGFNCVDFAADYTTGWLAGSKGRISKITLSR